MTDTAVRKTKRQLKKEMRKSRTSSSAAQGGHAASFTGKLRLALDGYDYSVVVLVLLLSVFGVAMVFSAGYYQTINFSKPDPMYFLFKQGFFVITGWAIMAFVAAIDYRHYTKLGAIALFTSVILLVLVLTIGETVNNAQRWITILGQRITPSEFSKVFMIIFTSVFLARNPDNIKTFNGLALLFFTISVHFILIVRQPNLSTAIVVVAIMMSIMFVAGLHPVFLILPVISGIAGYFYIIKYKTPLHWYQRLTSFIDPFADRQGDGYQVTQGLIALGNGGLKGLGFGRSIAKNLYLPEPQNDFILAIIGEELGYLGLLVLVGVYLFLIFRLILIAMRSKDRLGFYLTTGVAVMLGLQVIINIAVVTSSMPATGITLPFISYGGTSMWSFMIAMGIALNVSKKSSISSISNSNIDRMVT